MEKRIDESGKSRKFFPDYFSALKTFSLSYSINFSVLGKCCLENAMMNKFSFYILLSAEKLQNSKIRLKCAQFSPSSLTGKPIVAAE